MAQEARWQLGLEGVVLVPVGDAPHKDLERDPGAEARLAMVRAAAAGDGGLEVSPAEVESAGPSFTHLTLAGLTASRPGQDLWLVLGADIAATLEEWERPDRILELARIAIVPRPGYDVDDVTAALGRLGGADRAEIIDMPECSVSSTQIRERVAAGRPLRHLVPDAVIELIERRGWYR